MLIISGKEQRNLVKMEEVIDLAATALKEFSAGNTITPIRLALPFDNEKSTGLTMPSVAENLEAVGVKIVMVSPHNKKIGKKTLNGIVILSDFHTGEPIALLEGSFLTMIRTGALSGVATKYLAREDAKKLSIIGTGEQAKGLVEAVLAVRDIDEIFLYNRTEEKAKKFAEYIKNSFNKSVQIYKDVDEAVNDSDIIVTATNAERPVFSTELKPGVHINAVGSFRPNMQELPSHTITSADKIVVEAVDAAIEETGDLIIPLNEGVFSEDNIYGELGQIVDGKLKGRKNEEEITIFKSVGLAIVDIIVAKYLYEKALEYNMGTRIEL